MDRGYSGEAVGEGETRIKTLKEIQEREGYTGSRGCGNGGSGGGRL